MYTIVICGPMIYRTAVLEHLRAARGDYRVSGQSNHVADAPALIAPSTAQDPEHRLLRSAVAGLGSASVSWPAALARPFAIRAAQSRALVGVTQPNGRNAAKKSVSVKVPTNILRNPVRPNDFS